MLVLAAVIIIHLNDCRKSIVDDLYFDDFHIWEQNDVNWDTLCTHLSFREKVALNIHFSAEELTLFAAARKSRGNESNRRYRKKTW
jgi:hypothetical protein